MEYKQRRWMEEIHGSNCEKLEQLADQANHLNSEELMVQLTRRMEKIKFQSFGKVKMKVQTLDNDKELCKLYEQKNEQVQTSVQTLGLCQVIFCYLY